MLSCDNFDYHMQNLPFAIFILLIFVYLSFFLHSIYFKHIVFCFNETFFQSKLSGVVGPVALIISINRYFEIIALIATTTFVFARLNKFFLLDQIKSRLFLL